MKFKGLQVVTLGASLGTALATNAQAQACADLAGAEFGPARVLEATETPAGTVMGRAFDAPLTFTDPLCRVLGQIRPSKDSDIRFEVWLPTAAAWNGRYEGIGNGGNAGSAAYGTMKMALDGGYAVSGHDTGHIDASGDSDYAVGHPEKVVDFGWRSLHEVAVAAKAVIAAYYDRDAEMALYNGCSTGGRQGLVLAQRFPDDYDGIAVGAPANYWPELNAMGADFYHYLMQDPTHWVSPGKLAMVQGKVEQACGAIDGVYDDPGACSYDLAQLACSGADGPDCLTETELTSLSRRYSDLKGPSGELIYPGFVQGLESSMTEWWMGVSAEERGVSSYAWLVPEYFRDYVHGAEPEWVISRFDLMADLNAARHGVIGAAAAAEVPDLSGFAASGGKIIHYHGWHDMAIPATGSLRYYDEVLAEMGGPEAIAPFYRLFMGTGMNHCGGGDAPNSIGGAFGKAAPVRDAQHDVIEALAAWITDGVAPEQIVATQYDDAGAVMAQRPWCAHPATAEWDGTGDRSLPSSYTCRGD